jgi:hypothetical protein
MSVRLFYLGSYSTCALKFGVRWSTMDLLDGHTYRFGSENTAYMFV